MSTQDTATLDKTPLQSRRVATCVVTPMVLIQLSSTASMSKPPTERGFMSMSG